MRGTLALLAAAELADLLTTWYGMHYGGAREANRIVLTYVVGFGGWSLVAFVKFGTIPAVALIAWLAPSVKARALVLGATRIAALMLLGVALSNVLVVL